VTRSHELFDRAKRVLPGGVNSPVRAFRAVGGTPFFVAHAHGSSIRDVDGREYVDYVCSWGPLILGHAHPAVLEAVRQAAQRGWTYGAPCEAEVELAERCGGACEHRDDAVREQRHRGDDGGRAVGAGSDPDVSSS